MKEESIIRALESLSITNDDKHQIVVHVALDLSDLYDLSACLRECAEESKDFDMITNAVEFWKFFKHCKEVAHEAKNYE